MKELRSGSAERLDEVDLAILRSLASDGRKPIAQIAEEVGLTETPCARRLRQLESRGVITGYSAVIDPKAVNKDVSVVVFVQLKENFDAAFEAFTKAIEKFNAVQSCQFIAGEMDFLLLLRFGAIEELEDFARKQLGGLEMVRNFHSIVCIREILHRPYLKF